MSNVLYAYRFPKENLWKVIEEIREWYVQHDIGYVTARSLAESDEHFHTCIEIIDAVAEHAKCDLQLFEIGQYYYMRVIAQGYFFMNNHTEFTSLEPTFYDDRADGYEGMEQWRWLVDDIEELIKKRQYVLYPLVSVDDVQDYMWDQLSDRLSRKGKGNV